MEQKSFAEDFKFILFMRLTVNEFEFINELKKIKKNQNIILGMGDDTAILKDNLLVCSDSLVEDIHSSFKYFSIVKNN